MLAGIVQADLDIDFEKASLFGNVANDFLFF